MQTVVQKSLKDTMYFRDIPVFIYQINYPVFTTSCSPTAAQTVNSYYLSAAKAAETYCRAVLFPQALESARYVQPGRPFRSYAFHAIYRITYNIECITSLYLETYTYMGGALGETKRTSNTWDFRTGSQLHFSGICPLTPASLRQLKQRIDRQIAERLAAAPGSYFDNYSLLSGKAFDPDNYYLLPGKLVIYYQQYDIAPYATGIPEFYFPACRTRAPSAAA